MRSTSLALLVACVAGCATLTQDSLLDQRFGPADPSRFDRPATPPPGGVSYQQDVRPVLENRCVVCHGCYDAPCQLKLGSWEGIARGATKALVYDGTRLLEAPPTRLFVDAQLPSQWRQKDFHPVLNERTPTPENNLAASVLYRSLALKKAHPLPDEPVLSGAFDFSLDRAQTCARLGEFDAYERDHPLAGMPYGLPGLAPRELEVVTRWLAAGAPYDAAPALPAHVARQVKDWEQFLNGNSLKEQLMSRYLYEHLFLGHLVFEDDAHHQSFRIVRSTTAPGKPVVPVATRRPYEDPGVARVYYRLEPERETILAKTHMPYRLSAQRMAKYRGWFLDPAYAVKSLPSYADEQASNPFLTFAAIPPESRYRFLLDEAEFFIMNFIKGPVCRGQMALDVIQDRFWVFFMDPKSGSGAADAELAARLASQLRLPASYGSDSPALFAWLELARQETDFLAANNALLKQRFGGAQKVDLPLIWDGDGRNPNAALTVFRHFDSASVVKGLLGEPTETAWVIGYPLFERIYYLLVAGYDPYGNIGHQLNSRLYMDFLRMEGESNFLTFLPKAARGPIRDRWYRGASDSVKAYIDGSKNPLDADSGIAYRSNDPQAELYGMLSRRLSPVLEQRFDLATVSDAGLRQPLQTLSRIRGAGLAWLPEATVLRVDDPPRPPRYFSLLRNTAHSNVTHLMKEKAELLPAENTLTVVPGFIGAYPNAIYRATPAQLPDFARAIQGLASEADYRTLASRFAIRRTHPDFWAASDAMMQAYAQWSPLEAGLLDYNRLENR
jgi:hypothetical protein